ncbi:MAG: TM2 domain-containing protein [Ignavibacteriales bacterium]|nr:TM2 domain-containing protein [Ignavibacteriales bacterium]
MANILTMLPTLEGDEFTFIQNLTKDMTETQVQQFAMIYGARRREPQTLLLVTLIAFVGAAGVQRFLVRQIGMGILYLFTWGFCCIGTIIDLVNHRSLAFEFNWKVAQEVAIMVKSM